MPKKQKLELTWIGKDEQPKLEPRILVEDPRKSYPVRNRALTKSTGGNRSMPANDITVDGDHELRCEKEDSA